MDDAVTATPADDPATTAAEQRAALLNELSYLNPYTVLNQMRNRIAEINGALSTLPPDTE